MGTAHQKPERLGRKFKRQGLHPMQSMVSFLVEL